ncbi:MAG TPA: extracellular solute-binding protein [Magnetospirillaceae bacterium]|jgi:raffinose/stachyose/melibiose transport system substrate-binding protein
MRFKAFIGAAVGAAFLSSAAMADTTVHVLHLQDVGPIVDLWTQIVKDYNAANPGSKVELQYLENEALKAKLPTLLQSNDRPDLFHSWGGGVMRAQIAAGFIGDMTADSAALEKELSPGAANAFKVDGKVVGAPFDVSEVSFFYNKALFAKAGVKGEDIKTWDDFLGAVKKLKTAGITPIICGGGDKWPMHFYWSYLVLRAGGADILAQAQAAKDGFKGPAFVEAGKRLKELAALNPFQDGYLGATWPQAAGLWGDGKGAIQLMGNWITGAQQSNAADKKGLSNDNIGVFQFPTLPGGKGEATITLGGVDGFLISKSAPVKDSVKFLTFFSQPKYQSIAAAKGLYIPAAAGTTDAITDPVMKQVADAIAHSTKHQLFFDQDLGPSVGRVVNDSSVAIAAGEMSPEDGAAAVQKAWDEK